MRVRTRREFLQAAGAAVGGTVLGSLTAGCGGESGSAGGEEGFRFAMCNESMQDRPWAEQCRVIAEAGYTGVEIAPFTLVEEGVQEISADRRSEMVAAMEGAGLDCVGLHWLLSPPPEGLHFTSPDRALRDRTVEYLHRLIDFCGDLGGPYMIFGSPDQRSSSEGQPVEAAMENFAEGLAAVGDHAAERDVMVLVEPLSSDQTDVVNTLAEAMEVVRMADHPAISTMFDFHNTVDETEPMPALIERYAEHIHHVQIQEMDGRHLGTGDGRTEFVPVFRAFRDVGYEGWISLEVFDFSPGGETIARESMEVLRALEAEVT